MGRFASTLAVAFWLLQGAGALRTGSTVAVEEEGHVDMVAALEHAVGLMDEGIAHFMSSHDQKHQGSASKDQALVAAVDFLGKMSLDVKTLRKALGKFQRKRQRDELVTKRMEEELLAAEQQVKLLQAGKLQADEQAQQHATTSQECEDAMKGVPTGIKQLTQVQTANNDLQQKIADLQDENQQLQGQVVMLGAKAREAELLQGKVNILQAYQQRLEHGLKKAVQKEVHHEEGQLEDKLSYATEIAKDLQTQDVQLQKGNVALSKTVQKLRKQNKALQADKGHLLESMQSLLQQNNNCQQQLQLSPSNVAQQADIFQAAAGSVFSAQDIAAVASADVDSMPTMLLGGHRSRKPSHSLLHKKMKGQNKIHRSKARKIAMQPTASKPMDPDSVSILDDLSLPLAPEGLGLMD
eukprot:gnl/MRDRNA2_/MRDRNA2_117235_c0_seq1.p1 gnl/MRDRNA2_/MRDRNA2_117235_c0~~gnl/MRDRNA2_/MRDRNA2_117235_c0_seq1.p1  ORF type:complete len:410 (+),score=126.98 gnl/MRDRNA2_/MRDRNA2_117235_c0_seq1:126-1355(+)